MTRYKVATHIARRCRGARCGAGWGASWSRDLPGPVSSGCCPWSVLFRAEGRDGRSLRRAPGFAGYRAQEAQNGLSTFYPHDRRKSRCRAMAHYPTRSPTRWPPPLPRARDHDRPPPLLQHPLDCCSSTFPLAFCLLATRASCALCRMRGGGKQWPRPMAETTNTYDRWIVSS